MGLAGSSCSIVSLAASYRDSGSLGSRLRGKPSDKCGLAGHDMNHEYRFIESSKTKVEVCKFTYLVAISM